MPYDLNYLKHQVSKISHLSKTEDIKNIAIKFSQKNSVELHEAFYTLYSLIATTVFYFKIHDINETLDQDLLLEIYFNQLSDNNCHTNISSLFNQYIIYNEFNFRNIFFKSLIENNEKFSSYFSKITNIHRLELLSPIFVYLLKYQNIRELIFDFIIKKTLQINNSSFLMIIERSFDKNFLSKNEVKKIIKCLSKIEDDVGLKNVMFKYKDFDYIKDLLSLI